MTATKTSKTPGNATYYIAKGIVAAFGTGCVALSFSHIIDLAHQLDATGIHPWIAPATVDSFMLLGRLGMSRRLDATTNKVGRWVMIGGAIISLIANIAAGHTNGDKIIGGAVVFGFLFAEWYAPQLKPAAPAELTPAQKGAQTRARNAAASKAAGTAKAPAKRKPATKTTTAKPRTRKANTATVKPANAIVAAALAPYANTPVSPAPYMAGQLLVAKSPADVRALTN